MPNVFVEMIEGKPVSVYYTQEDAYEPGELVEVPLFPLAITVQRYFKFRGLKMPNAREAFLFLTSEIGELADELVQTVGGWVRNNPEEKGRGLMAEIGDVLMMLLVFCMAMTKETHCYHDPIDAMFEKWKSKGFPITPLRGVNASRQKEAKKGG